MVSLSKGVNRDKKVTSLKHRTPGFCYLANNNRDFEWLNSPTADSHMMLFGEGSRLRLMAETGSQDMSSSL